MRSSIMSAPVCRLTDDDSTSRFEGTYYRYDEELVVPIIENTPFEEDLQVKLELSLNSDIIKPVS